MISEDNLLSLYIAVAEEFKVRVSAINFALGGAMAQLPAADSIAAEFCYLQLRMMCELIALGCLIAHGDIQGASTSKILKEYSAERILKMLSELEPQFFPYPTSRRRDPNKHNGWLICGPRNADYTTKEELIALYRRTGEYLHRGSLKNFAPLGRVSENELQEITKAGQRLIHLMNEHSIILVGGRRVLICALSQAELGGAAKVDLIATNPNSPTLFARPADGSGRGL